MNIRGAVLAVALIVGGSAINLLVPYCAYSAPDKARSSFDPSTGSIDVAFSRVEGYVPVWQYQVTKRTVWGRVLLQELGIVIVGGAVFGLVGRRRPAAGEDGPPAKG